MSTPPVSAESSLLRKTAIEDVLREGYAPFRESGGKGSSVQEAAKRLGMASPTLANWITAQQRKKAAGETSYEPDWTLYKAPLRQVVESRALVVVHNPARRWLLTAAQDDTAVHWPFWNNLNTYARDIGAEVMVGGFTYQKGLFEDHASRSAVFAEALRPYLQHDNVECGPLLFAAKMNSLPTAVRPLSGLDTYSRGRWAVFPHAKIQLVSVPALPGEHPAHVMTTGACTVANYIEKKAGLKAEFHHQIGATLVEVDGAGRVFCRQIAAADDGSFQDLDAIVRGGAVTRGHRVEAITWGDIHREQIDPVVAATAWGLDVETGQRLGGETIIDALRPRHQFFHDLLDFRARNHHRKGDHHHRRAMLSAGDSVDADIKMCAQFLRQTERDFCTSVVVPSNHNDAFQRWLRESDPREDALNGPIWCRANAAMYDAIDAGDKGFDVFRWALERHDPLQLSSIEFPSRGSSYITCQAAGGIENALHGDKGPNGSRGSALALTKVAVRMNIGHAHTPGILDGVYTAGLCGLLDQGYNDGPSGWSHTQIVTYPNGRRTLITIIDGKWRA